MKDPIFPYGHFYSPIVDVDLVKQDEDLIWRSCVDKPGVCFNPEGHQEILNEWFPRFIADYNYPDRGDPASPESFFNENDQFSWLDARALFVFLRKMQPAKVIEVGSGFSSLLIADVNRTHLGNCIEFTCIEPFPRAFLKNGIEGVTELLEMRVQEVPLEVFEKLGKGDILFIDSSHVAKTGSDVNYLFLEVLPRLRCGVIVHIHDIFLPLEYPKEWVIDENRSWNEQYLLHALLLFSSRFRVLFGSAYAALCHPHAVVKALARPDGHGMSGGSFWIEVV